jgi:hypothetical protein
MFHISVPLSRSLRDLHAASASDHVTQLLLQFLLLPPELFPLVRVLLEDAERGDVLRSEERIRVATERGTTRGSSTTSGGGAALWNARDKGGANHRGGENEGEERKRRLSTTVNSALQFVACMLELRLSDVTSRYRTNDLYPLPHK